MLKTIRRPASRRRTRRAGGRHRRPVPINMTAKTVAKARRAPPHPNPKVIRQAEKIFAAMGITRAEAIALFYKQTALHGAFPITKMIPNEATQAAILEPLESLVSYPSVDAMMADLWRDTNP